MRSDPLASGLDRTALLRVHRSDDVAIALRPLEVEEQLEIEGQVLTVQQPVPVGHKLALRPLQRGAEVRKFGWPIGRMTADAIPGEHVHSHNLATLLEDIEAYRYTPIAPEPLPPTSAVFQGYRRGDGPVGTRNEIWILPTVGCVARTAGRIAEIARARHAGAVDGIHAFSHPFGCSQLGDDLAGTRSLLAALASHPNAGGVLLIGLGCESNQLDALLAEIPLHARSRVRSVLAQSSGDEVADGLAAIDALVANARLACRTEVSIGELVVGLKCGGSDGFSGLTANPLVGRIADFVNGAGGSTILSEIPEVFGAERGLMARARDRHVFEGIVAVVNDFKRHFLDHGQPISENPSPGNIAGGITTLEEKSLGAVQKSGGAAVADVLRYGQMVRRKGLTLLEAPGNDAISSTALAAAGATVILFTTGRGTPLGTAVPTLKIASNSSLAARKPGWIDFDAGQVLHSGVDVVAADLLTKLTAVASGEQTASERNDEREIAIWKRGITL
ncbi:altronate dehydratase family protein [Altererythrobacter sp. Root672]|uniref:UxaA family hydrolase n=1 Tax=Altererythrobacter sp. Root672 TaxID=1736584 RepID=UPI0012E386C8